MAESLGDDGWVSAAGPSPASPAGPQGEWLLRAHCTWREGFRVGPGDASALDKGSGEGGLSPRSPEAGVSAEVCRGSRWCLSYKSAVARSS